MHICKECKPTGAMSDILMNPDCPNCTECQCSHCDKNMFGEDPDMCPLENTCEDCNHIHGVTDCAYSSQTTIERK